MAERGGHAPHHAKCATIALAKHPGSLVRFTFRWCPRRDCRSGGTQMALRDYVEALSRYAFALALFRF